MGEDDEIGEIGLREGRARFGELISRAEYGGTITYITRHGRRVAAIVPLDRIAPAMQETHTRTDPAELRRLAGQRRAEAAATSGAMADAHARVAEELERRAEAAESHGA